MWTTTSSYVRCVTNQLKCGAVKTTRICAQDVTKKFILLGPLPGSMSE